MATPEPPPEGTPQRSRGAHRAAPASRSRVIPVVAAAAVIAALGLAAYVLLTSGDDDANGPGANPTTSAAPSGTSTRSGQPTKSPSATPTKSGSGHTHEPTHKPTHKPTQKPPSTPVPQTPVYVFNQTTISGLAAQLGSQLSQAGWNVVGIDNWRGFVPEDTVYYWPGDRAAAQRLSHDFGDIGRVWPASSPMPQGALTVILATTDRK